MSSPDWLEAHHRAKLTERSRFAESIAGYRPKKVVDLGCATGLWLDLFDKHLSAECEFVGLDNDRDSLDLAQQRAEAWRRPSDFKLADLSRGPEQIPTGADVILAFNILSYLPNIPAVLESIYSLHKGSRLIVRQYDGGTIRLGPLQPDDRVVIDASLRASLEASSQVSYYAMDDTYRELLASPLTIDSLAFELTERHSPFPADFREYFDRTVAWTRGHLSDAACERLDRLSQGPQYFAELNLIAVLSSPP